MRPGFIPEVASTVASAKPETLLNLQIVPPAGPTVYLPSCIAYAGDPAIFQD